MNEERGSSNDESNTEKTFLLPTRLSHYYKKKSQDRADKVKQTLRKNLVTIIVGIGVFSALLLLGIFNSSWRGMTWQGWFSVIVTVLSLLLLIAETFRPAFIFLSAMSVCYLFRIITSEQALEGFSNSGVITIAALFIIAKTIELSDILKYLVKFVLRYPKSIVVAQIRLIIPVAFLSAFINNTPIVAMMIPVVEGWCFQCNMSASYLMMPLSYAAIIGGTCTLIGTSTNLIVLGLVQSEYPNFQIGFFEIGIVGLPVAVVSIIYMVLFSRLLLPANRASDLDPPMASGISVDKLKSLDNNVGKVEEESDIKSDNDDDNEIRLALEKTSEDLLSLSVDDNTMNRGKMSSIRAYVISMIVTNISSFKNKTVEEKGLDKLKGVTLFKIMRRKTHVYKSMSESDDSVCILDTFQQERSSALQEYVAIMPVAKNDVILEGDLLFFESSVKSLSSIFSLDGLLPATTQLTKIEGKRKERVVMEAVIGNHSDLVGKTIGESHFRSRFNAVIIAIHRHGSQIHLPLSHVLLHAGDTLLIEGTPEFLQYHQYNDSDFALISEVSRGYSHSPRRISFGMIFVVTLAVAMVIIAAGGWEDLLAMALVIGNLYVVFGNISWPLALSSLQGEMLLIIAAAFGLGNALDYSGAAQVISITLLDVFSLGGRIGVLAGLYAATALLSAVISNGATVTLMFPIAQSMAYTSGISITSIMMVLMMAASCSFMTPIGYQTNLMVMEPGGYSTLDYLKFGFPLTVVDLVFTVGIAYYVWVDDFLPQYESYYEYLPPLSN